VFPIRNAVATRYPPVATWTLVAINCAVFLRQLGLGPGEPPASCSAAGFRP
jgi:hypothetical protein